MSQQIADSIQAGGIKTLPTSIAERTVYRSLFAQGGTLGDLKGTSKSAIDSARANAASFAHDVLEAMNMGRVAA